MAGHQDIRADQGARQWRLSRTCSLQQRRGWHGPGKASLSEDRSAAGRSRSLVRGLSLVPAAAIIVTNVIGTGVFVKARVMTCNVGTPWMVLLAYLVAGVFTLAGALTFAELSAMMPRAGGQYNFIGAAFGRVWAFLYGWMETLLDGAASMAAVAIVFILFLNDLLGGSLSSAQIQLLTAGTIMAVTLLTLASMRTNGLLATIITTMKVLLVAGIGLAAFVFGDGSWAHFGASGANGACEGVPAGARLGATGFGAAVIGALWSYNGWADVSFIAEEVRDPGRTLPRALVGGSVLIIGLYLLVNAGYFYALSPEAVANVSEASSVAGAVLVRMLGAGGASLLTIGLMLSTFGALHSTCLAVARVPFAMARDGLLPHTFATVSPRARVPAHAIVLLGACAVGFAFSGTFDVLTDLIVFMLLLFNGLGVASIYVLRHTLPDAARPFRVCGYPVVPAVFLVATAYLMINTFLATPLRVLAGVGIVALGLPLYAWYARRLPPGRPEDWLVGGPVGAPHDEA
ncbi:MAG: amino acid permease [Rudaea sp.]|nr:amino acid permease [Rudaea sp.]